MPEEPAPQTAVTPSPTRHPAQAARISDQERFWGALDDCPVRNPPGKVPASASPATTLTWVSTPQPPAPPRPREPWASRPLGDWNSQRPEATALYSSFFLLFQHLLIWCPLK